jgi:DNA-binding protein HU-beta
MKKDEIVQAVADAAGIEKAAANRALDAVVDVITSSVASGQKIQIPGLGTFEPRERNAREGRNPQTGETIQIAAGHSVKLTAGSKLKAAVAKK